ncbi:hypothetical protein SPRG_14078 [Saprolegnia parasitica CBS 223.65]|uniref:Uncharacterized protein n=1 Tax=Saprolegnia parasitica (strain CBS 223.65) TaxID=695850 RepID=A0A067C218_SAPPC|nr:hypothetical protein SPRG_14078 [Saprolegnia parasitica CBS 223.65]KDO20847.1 hypothetical protein SPRG_14078 [Saprolegnia parasitica CBS 223.65]|eukprot:XP_012208425.1 hypothetical protein SPRG_14078 [Saprolegnia parasitica CBS 223.65]
MVNLLPLLSLAAVALAQDCAPQDAHVASLQKDLATLQATEAQHKADLVTVQTKFEEEAAAVSGLQTQLNSAVNELAAITSEKDELIATVAKLQAADVSTELKAEVSTLVQDKQALSDKLKKLDADNAAHQRRIEGLQAELAASKDALTQVKTLQAKLTTASKEIESLQETLKRSAEGGLSLPAMISTYYDNAVTFTTQTYEDSDRYVSLASSKATELYAIHLAPWADEAVAHSTVAAKTVQDLYTTHAAATVDPLLDQLHATVQPILDVQVPIAKQRLARAQDEAVVLAKRGQDVYKRSRKNAIAFFKSNPRIAPYATKIVDTTIVLLSIPIAIALLRLAVSTVFVVLSTLLYLVTCCGCCGLVGRKPKTTREVATPVVTAPTKATKPMAKAQTNDSAPKAKAPKTPEPVTPPSAKKKKAKKTQ